MCYAYFKHDITYKQIDDGQIDDGQIEYGQMVKSYLH